MVDAERDVLMRQLALLLTWLRRTLASEWQGPPDLPRALTLEWKLVTVRWLGIVSVGPALLVMHLPADRLVAAFGILVFATVYNVTVRHYMWRKPSIFEIGRASCRERV